MRYVRKGYGCTEESKLLFDSDEVLLQEGGFQRQEFGDHWRRNIRSGKSP